MAMNGHNGRTSDGRRRLIERLAAIRIHAGTIRRAALRPGPMDKRAVIEQLEHIDGQVTQATQLLESNPSALH